jgi:hypothetical protein
MGKRELLIIAVFVAAGAVAYQLTAPAKPGGSGGFSFSTVFNNVRREIRANRAVGSVTSQGTIGDVGALADVRVSGVAEVAITGEARPDVGYELTVESSGEDAAAARISAGRTTLAQDRVGPSLILRVSPVRGTRQTAHLTLRVPARLTAHVEGAPGGTRVTAEGVAALELDAVVGDSTARRVAGAISGSHRNGSLRIAEAGSVNLTLVSSKATLDQVAGPIALTARNGGVEIRGSRGRIELEVTNEDTVIVEPHGTVRVGGSGGRVRVTAPQAVTSLDMRRAAITVTVSHAVALTAITTDAPMQILLDGPPPIAIDAMASEGGTVNAEAIGAHAATTDQESRVHHAFPAARASVALRNQRAPIEIAMMK